MRGTPLIILIVLLFGLPGVSRGAVVTYAFEGVVDSVGSDPLAPVTILPGELLVYEYTFDTDPPYIGGNTYAAIGASITVGDDYLPVVPTTMGEPPVVLWAQMSAPDFLWFGHMSDSMCLAAAGAAMLWSSCLICQTPIRERGGLYSRLPICRRISLPRDGA
jgi:hypothetical protein